MAVDKLTSWLKKKSERGPFVQILLVLGGELDYVSLGPPGAIANLCHSSFDSELHIKRNNTIS